MRMCSAWIGEQQIAAVVGGFHLSGPMFEAIIEPTVAAFDELSPSLLVPVVVPAILIVAGIVLVVTGRKKKGQQP